MKTKSIIFTSPKIAELVDEEIGAPSAGMVTVRILRTTVSAGTERSNLVGDPNVSPDPKTPVKFPRSSGYSCAGIVTAVGDGVTSVKVGDRVAASWSKHTNYYNLKESAVYKLPDTVGYDSGALVHITTFPMAAIRKCRLEMGESAIVMGMGVLGMVSVKLLRLAGAAPIIAVDPSEEKRKIAISLGADFALDPFAPDFAERAKALTGGGADVAIEVTGKGAGLDGVLDCMKKFGRVALLGCTRSSDFTIDYYRKVHGPGITLIGAHTIARPKCESHGGWWTERDDALAAIKLIEMGRLDVASMISEIYQPSDAPAVYTRLANEPIFPIVQFDWSLID